MSYTFEQGKELLSLVKNASDGQLENNMRLKLITLLDTAQDAEQLRQGLREIMDYCVNGGLASTFMMKHFHYTWEGLGGKLTDPTPWRDK